MTIRFNEPFKDEFIEGVLRVARRRCWQRTHWEVTVEEVFQMFAVRCWAKWKLLNHASDVENRCQQASWLAHSVRSSVCCELNKSYRRKRIHE